MVVKLKLNNGKAGGMYLLLDEDEIRYTKDEETKPPNRDYKIQVTAEVMYNNKRCRGKFTSNVAKGTSLIKAVDSLQGRKQEMVDTLRKNGTLKIEKIVIAKSTKSRVLDVLFDTWLNNKIINKKASTIKTYKFAYKGIQNSLGKMVVDTITEADIQNQVFEHINKKRASNTIRSWMQVLKAVLTYNDVLLNWKKIELPKDSSERKYKHSIDTTREIVKVLTTYPHSIARGVFVFLLTGRRLTETLYLEHRDIDYVKNTFTIRAENAKTNKDFTFTLTPEMIEVIKLQGTSSGRIFRLQQRQMLEHFKKAVHGVGVHDMVLHDLRSMVAQTALDSGADIYSVSTMLAHSSIATTQKRYVSSRAEHSKDAQNIFSQKTISFKDEVIDTEMVDNFEDALQDTIRAVEGDYSKEAILELLHGLRGDR